VAAGDLGPRCLSAERAFSVVLGAAAFLARYRMLTVRDIVVEAPRFEAESYEVDLGLLNAADTSALGLYRDAENRRKTRRGNSHSIVLARDERELDDCLNLSPFVIDKNTFVGGRQGGGGGGDKPRLADVFMLSYQEGERLVYLAVQHSLTYALQNARDRVHTDMTRGDFAEGRNLAAPPRPAAPSDDEFLLDDDEVVVEQEREHPEDKVRVFDTLRAQFDAFLTDTGAAPTGAAVGAAP
jgi:hypothetical protein